MTGAGQSRADDLFDALERLEIATTPVLTRMHETKRQYLKSIEDTYTFNPSVARLDDQLTFVSKAANYRVVMESKYIVDEYPVEIKNFLHISDLSLKTFQTTILDDSLIRQHRSAKDGVADIHLFVWKQSIWGIGAGITRTNGLEYLAEQVLFRIDEQKVVEFFALPSPNNLPREKNWMPIVADHELYFVYSVSPFTLYNFTEKGLVLTSGPLPNDNNFDIRGGTPFVRLGKKFVAMVHLRPVETREKTFYRHAFIVVDDSLRLEELSEPFFIQRKGAEFACGLDTFGDGVILAYGVSNRRAAYCLLSAADLMDWIII